MGRTKKRIDTWNATSNQWNFPQTPSRVQLSLWPAGLATNGQGTVDWAGGLVDWNSADIKNNGYYYATFKSVTISCYNASSDPGTNSGKSYTYSDYTGSNSSVVDGSGDTVLKSFLGTGTDMDAGESTATGTASTASATVQTIPGLSGGGVGGAVGQHSGSGSSGSGTSGGSGSSSAGSASGSSPTFVQGDSGTSQSGAEKLGAQERVLGGSMFAAIIAVVAMMAL